MSERNKQEILFKIESAEQDMYNELEYVFEATASAISDSIDDNYENKNDYYGGAAWSVAPKTEWMHSAGYGSIMERSGALKSAASSALVIQSQTGSNFTYTRVTGVDHSKLPESPRGFNYGAHHDAGDFKFLPTDDEIEMGYTDDFDVLGGMYDPIDELERLTDDFESKVDDIMNELDMFD